MYHASVFRHTKSEAVHAKPKVLMNDSVRNTKSEAVHTKPKVLMNGSMSNTRTAQMAGPAQSEQTHMVQRRRQGMKQTQEHQKREHLTFPMVYLVLQI